MVQQPVVNTGKSDLLHEVGEFIFATIWLGVAFGIAMAGGYRAFGNLPMLRIVILQSLIVVVFAFVLHELAHRVVARHYGHKAVFRMWVPGLVLAALVSLTGWLFAAPGGVYIDMADAGTPQGKARLGKSALAGPIVNMVLALLFVGATMLAAVIFSTYVSVAPGVSMDRIEPVARFFVGVTLVGVEINLWLALFNLLPFGSFDGLKVFAWSKKAWIISFAAAVALYGAWWWIQGQAL